MKKLTLLRHAKSDWLDRSLREGRTYLCPDVAATVASARSWLATTRTSTSISSTPQ